MRQPYDFYEQEKITRQKLLSGAEQTPKALGEATVLFFDDLKMKECYKKEFDLQQAIKNYSKLLDKYPQVTSLDASRLPFSRGGLQVDQTSVANERILLIICEALKNNTTLIEVNLSRNAYEWDPPDHSAEGGTYYEGDKEAPYVSELLKVNTTIKRLRIEANRFSPKGIKSIAEGLAANSTLQLLNVSKNWLDEEGAQYLLEAVEKNTTLTSLNHYNVSLTGPMYSDWFPSEDTQLKIEAKLRENRSSLKGSCSSVKDALSPGIGLFSGDKKGSDTKVEIPLAEGKEEQNNNNNADEIKENGHVNGHEVQVKEKNNGADTSQANGGGWCLLQ